MLNSTFKDLLEFTLRINKYVKYIEISIIRLMFAYSYVTIYTSVTVCNIITGGFICMKKLKSFVAILLCSIITLSLVGCGTDEKFKEDFASKWNSMESTFEEISENNIQPEEATKRLTRKKTFLDEMEVYKDKSFSDEKLKTAFLNYLNAEKAMFEYDDYENKNFVSLAEYDEYHHDSLVNERNRCLTSLKEDFGVKLDDKLFEECINHAFFPHK